MKEANIEENIKNKIIDLIAEGSEDRLIVFKPGEEAGSPDLVVKKRGEYKFGTTVKKSKPSFKVGQALFAPPKNKSKELSFQLNIFIGPSETDIIIKDIPLDSLTPSKDFYLMFIYFDEIEQDVSNVWVIPFFMFSKMAETQKLEDDKIILRFETTVSPEKKDKYSRFLIDKKELGNFLLEIVETKDNINFTKNSFAEGKVIDLDKLKKFIAEARKNTYSTDLKPITNPRLHGSLQLEYQKEDYFYQDIYFTGLKIFIGLQIVYYKNRSVWVMNYCGDMIEKDILAFLKESLLKLSQECRFGKSCQFGKRDLKYQDDGQGNLEYFSGKEQIFQKNKNIYNLTYQGGLISK